MDLAILGAGNVGQTLGKLWSTHGHSIHYGVRNHADPKYKNPPHPNATFSTNAQAAAACDVIVLCTHWDDAREAIAASGNLAGKVLVDVTNPVKRDLSGLQLGTTTSAHEEI